mgnify:FL=1
MKYILWKKLKTKTVNEFESENIQEVLDYAILKGYEYLGIGYIGGFALFTDGKYNYSVQGQVSGMVCSYDKNLINIKSVEELTPQS